VSREIMGVYW